MNPFKYAHNVINQLALGFQSPGITHFVRTLKRPNNPKVVVFGNSKRVFEILSKEFASFNQINFLEVKSLGESEQVNTVAQNALRLSDGTETGHIIVDFPRNAKQALQLDLLTEGVNLALFLRDPTDTVTATQQKEVLDYYRKTGSLVEIDVDPKGCLKEQLAQVSTQVLNGYKL